MPSVLRAAATVAFLSVFVAAVYLALHASFNAAEVRVVRNEIERAWQYSFSEADVMRLRSAMSYGEANNPGPRLAWRHGHFLVVVPSPSVDACASLADDTPPHVLEMAVSRNGNSDTADQLEQPGAQCGKDAAVLEVTVERPYAPSPADRN